MENNLSVMSGSSEKRVNKLVSEINNICDQLISAFEISNDKVMSYGYSIADEMDTVFVDKIIFAIDKLKLHAADLKNHLSEIDEKLVAGLMAIQNKLTSLLLSNNYYLENFQMPIREVNNSIQEVLDNVKVGELAA